MTWLYNKEPLIEIPDGYYGFVYRIINKATQQEYIGKKFFFAQKQRQVKGKKKKYKAESDWKEYYGSNEVLAADVLSLGKDNFERYILKLCKTKGECTYFETKYQFQEDVLLNPDKYYNTWIMCKVHRKHLKITDAG